MLLAMRIRNEGLAGPRALVLAVSIAALCGLSPRVSGAVEPDEVPWLRRIPDVAAEMTRLPPFVRDTDLRLLLRSYYLNARNANETLSEAWAGGAWLTYRSGWLLDTFQMGATVFSSVPLYAPSDRDGTQLLAPGQEGFIVPGVAYGALRYGDYALLTGYRQIVEQTYVNPHDNRMAPVTYEGVTLGGKVGFADYLVGYLTRQKERDSETFVPIGEAVGVRGNGAGLTLAGVRLRPIQGLSIELSNQIVDDVFNTAFGQVDYAHAFDRNFVLTVAGQYTDQRAVGDALLGGSKFTHWVTTVGSMRAQLHYHDFTLTTAFSVTGKGNNLQTPFGQYPGFLHMLIRDFDRAGEVAWMAGIGYDLSRWIPETRSGFSFAQGTSAVSPTKRTAAPDIREYNFGMDHRAAKHSGLHGFGFAAVAGIVDIEGTNRPQYQIRLILNYEIPLL